MNTRRKLLAGSGAASVVAAASLLGAQAASADDTCRVCQSNIPGLGVALEKWRELGFPGMTDDVLFKFGGAQAFVTLSELGFPGVTETIFQKV
jgi:hypothetical protein